MVHPPALHWARFAKGVTALAVSLAFCAAPASAADEVGMFLDLKINQSPRGEFVTYRSTDGDFLVRLSDFPELGLKRDISLPRIRIEGEIGSFVSLRVLGAVSMVLDSAQMTLDVELPPELFETTTVDINAQTPGMTRGSERSSGFVNYRLASTSFGTSGTGTSNSASTSLATELGLRYGGMLLLNQSQFRDDGSTSRYLTQLIYDRPEVQQRWIAGDFTAHSGELGSDLPMGGLNLSKFYTLSPDLVRQPMAGYAGVATSPSQVEVRVGGVPVAFEQVGAGPFELQNLRQYGGASDVQVVIRDALGRVQVSNFPFYYSDTSLRTGLHEYSYSFGNIRSNIGRPGDSYDDTAISAFHRFGYTDSLTLGGRAEAAENLNNVGLEATWRDDRLGVLAAGVSGSNYQGRSGQAGLLAYNYQWSSFRFNSIARRYSADYATLEALTNGFNRSADYGASLSWNPGSGTTVNLSHALSQTRAAGGSRISSASINQHLGANGFLYATLQRSQNDNQSQPDTSLFVGWLYRFGNKYTSSANANLNDTGSQTLQTQFAQDIPYGEGIGYRVGWTGTQPQNSDRFNGYAQWNLPAASVSLDANALPAGGGNTDYHELAVAGSVAFAGNAWGFTRQIDDSFAIVELGVPVPGVGVLSNNQPIGVTNHDGQVISPFLGSFYASQIAINDQDIPLQYVMGKDTYRVQPAYRSGVTLNFGLRQVRGVDGILHIRTGKTTATADNRIVTLTKNGQLEQEFQVGRDGRFYIENMDSGEYRGSIKNADQSCSFAMQVPQSQDIVYTLPGVLICE